MLSGCTKEKTNKLQGFWSLPPLYIESCYVDGEYHPSYHQCYDVLEFANSNTLFHYYGVFDSKWPLEVVSHDAYSVPEHSGWWYSFKIPYTYAFEDNKVIVSNGEIYTYMGGILYLDGCSDAYSPW